jgi:hypothetical protein
LARVNRSAAAAASPTAPVFTAIAAMSAIVRPMVSPGAASFAIDIVRHRHSGLNFTALLERGLTRKFHPSFVVDPDAFHPDHFADLGDVFDPANPEVRQLRDVDETILARENFDEGTEFLD